MGTQTEYFHRLMNGPEFGPGEEMKDESFRLSSFKQWPHWALVHPRRLARAGLYYSGTDDEVICFSCGGHIKEWAKGDKPASEHRRRFPDCANSVGESPMQPEEPQSFSTAEGTNNEVATSLESAYHYLFEEERLRSFAAWPKPFIRPDDLAKAGFYYLGDADRAQCAFCRGVLRNWDPGDVPDTEHRQHFPDCPLINGRNVGNVAIARGVTREASSENVRDNDRPVGSTRLGVNTERAKHPNMTNIEERMLSYTSWPSSSRQEPRVLAEAGFFYAGNSDNVKCFYCDGGLRNWEPGDEAWMEHARWFPRCSFLRQCKGEQFVNDTQACYGNPSGSKALVPDEGQFEINRGNGYYETSNLNVSQTPVGDNFPNAKSLLEAYWERVPVNISVPEQNHSTAFQSKQAKRRRNKKNKKNKRKYNSTEDEKKLDKMVDKGVEKSEEKDTKSLIEENRELKKARTCKVCLDEEVSTVFLPCGHLVCCGNCAPAMLKCPICRGDIQEIVEIIMS